jgi:hypothetical protein
VGLTATVLKIDINDCEKGYLIGGASIIDFSTDIIEIECALLSRMEA